MINIRSIWKVLGAIFILIPGFVVLKEWAYAGFFFVISGAVFAHLSLRDPIQEFLPAVLLLSVMVASRYCRPIDRKLNFNQ